MSLKSLVFRSPSALLPGFGEDGWPILRNRLQISLRPTRPVTLSVYVRVNPSAPSLSRGG